MLAKLRATPKNFNDCKHVFNTNRTTDECSIRLGNNTYLESYTDDRFCIRLRETNIIEFYADGRVVLHTGGWYTVTTKARLNAFLHNGRIHQDAGIWYYSTLNEDGSIYAQRRFHEGLVVAGRG